ncbi:MAG TPA: DinB family protein [Calditrichia bacterium]|nr:DinB family protein [Calditrichota bacterium]HQV31299.1 DinB family protein [Calditrichia bacterium]
MQIPNNGAVWHNGIIRSLVILSLIFSVSMMAQDKMAKEKMDKMAQDKMAEAGMAKSGPMEEDFMKLYGFTSGKMVQLAEAIPAEKYDWRPADGVRSVKESVLHAAAANYFMANFLGTPIPEGVDARNLEKSVESKDDAIAALKASMEHVKGAIASLKPGDWNTEIEFFGMSGTKRFLVFIVGDHAAEHLGQLIAYARMNGVTPPWSKKAE